MFVMMESITSALQPHKDVIGIAAGLLTIVQFLSGSLVCRDIIKKRSTEHVSIVPFIGGLVISVLNLQYGWMLKDLTAIYVNVAGIIFNIAYIWVYATFLNPGPQSDEATKITNIGCAITAVCLGYTWIEDPSVVEFRYGLILTGLLLLLIASPLINLGEVIRTKDASSLPFPIIFMGTIVLFLWLLYGLAIKNEFIIAQNIAGFALSAVQLSLFAIFPKPTSTPNKLKENKKIK